MALEAADLDKIKELVTGLVAPVHEAVKPENLAKTLAPVIDAHVKEGTKGAVTPDALKASLDELVTKLKPAEPPRDESKPGKPGKPAEGEKAPELVALEAEIAKLKKANEDAVAAAQAEREKARAERLHGAARDALIKNGAKPEFVDTAMSRLRDLGVLTYDGDRPGWKGKNEVGLDAVLDIDAQAKAWLGTAEGKLFLPPVGAKGTGEGRGNEGGGPGPGDGEASLDSLRSGAGGLALGALKSAS